MEIYLLSTNIGIFLGLLGLVLLADKRRRANIDQFAQTSQILNESLKTLQEIHSTSF